MFRSKPSNRAALLAGSALMAASFSAGAVFAPGAANAADECGAQAGTTPITCPGGGYASGITYSSTANFTLNTTGAVTVGATGMDITGAGSNSVTLDTTAGAVTGAGGIEVTSGTGAVTINAGGVAGGIVVDSLSGAATITSTGGNIDVSRARAFDDSGSVNGNVSLTGAGDITLFHAGSGTITTVSSGGGLTHIIHSNTSKTNSVAGAIDATVRSGGLILDITGVVPEGAAGSSSARYESGVTGLTVRGAGAAEINIARDEIGTAGPTSIMFLNENYARLAGAVDLSGLAGGADVNVGANGVWMLPVTATLSPGDDAVHIGEGGFMSMAIFTSTSQTSRVHTIDFGGGDNHLLNEGRILLSVERILINSPIPLGGYGGTPRDRYEAELILQNLNTFENNGEIWFGTSDRSSLTDGVTPADLHPENVFYHQGTDRVADDMLTIPGGTFIGGPNGRLLMDMNLAYLGVSQDRCDNSIRDGGGNLPAADCINLQNGATEGIIYLNISDTNFGGRGAFNPNGVVIIDMSDGAGGPGAGAGGAAGQVAFAPEMRFYNPNFGGVLDNGMFMILPVYDGALKQHKLVSLPSGGAFHQPLIVTGAQSAWRTANAGFFDRQADLRDTARGGERRTSGAWLRANYEDGERTVRQTFSVESGDVVYENTHDLNVSSITTGVDFLGTADGSDYWVAGGMLGYVRTDLEYDKWTDAASMNGMLVGLYGGFVEGPMFVDASVSGIWNRLDQDLPQAELFRNAKLSTDVNTIGVQGEAGWRFELGSMQLEPLINASWVRTKADDLQVPEDDPVRPGNKVMFEEATSTRAGLGLRGSTMRTISGDVNLGVSITGRYSREFDGKASAAIGNLNPVSPVVSDAFDGNFGEVVGGVTVQSRSGRIAGVFNFGPRFGDDYESMSASASFRYQW